MRQAIKMLGVMICLLGIIYPLLVTLVVQVAMPDKANGSLRYSENHVIGSELIAQKFFSPSYFWPRPSAIDYNPMVSGGSNLGPTSLRLQTLVQERQRTFSGFQSPVPAELVYASGSGIDPHISVEAAIFQSQRIIDAQKRKELDREKLLKVIDSLSERSPFLPYKYVNVLLLNQTLDDKYRIRE